MANLNTSIQWTDATWSPVTGCTKVSAGCRNCYAERLFPRAYSRTCKNCGLRTADCNCDYFKQREFTDVLTHPDRLEQPLHWKKPRRIFVNSMSDLFHEDVPFEFIDRVFAVMALTPQHTYQILTKRPERMLQYLREIENDDRDLHRWQGWACELSNSQCAAGLVEECDWPLPNVWLGVSCEDQKTADERIYFLLQTPAAVRFVSYEPGLGPVSFRQVASPWGCLIQLPIGRSLRASNSRATDSMKHPKANMDVWLKVLDQIAGIHWVIVGGESGPGARPFNIQWARDVIAQCKAAGVACFMKQVGQNPYEAPNGITPYTSGPRAIECRLLELDIDKSHGGDSAEWPEDLRVREFPK